jgi:glutamyl-tRNA synthetase
MVNDPRRIKLVNFDPKEIKLANHPTKDLGKRTVSVNGTVLISGSDAEEIKEGEAIRLLGLGVIRINTMGDEIIAEMTDSNDAEKKIQWVAENEENKKKSIIPGQLFNGEKFNEDSLRTVEVLTESAYLDLKDDSEIQFVRFGYCRKESGYQAIFSYPCYLHHISLVSKYCLVSRFFSTVSKSYKLNFRIIF